MSTILSSEREPDLRLEIRRNERGRPVGRLLTGTDADGCAVSAHVPLRCKTVDEALAWLRPADVRPDDPRQGDLYFSPVSRFSPDDTEGVWAVEEERDTGTIHEVRVTYHRGERILGTRHRAEEMVVMERRGTVAFVGRRGVAYHDYVARPQVWVRGEITHPEHPTLDLDPELWHVVVPQRGSDLPFGGVGD